MYDLDDPLILLNKTPPTKSSFKEHVMTKIAAFHEHELKTAAKNNSKMKFLNVNLSSLRGQHHPCLSNIVTTNDVRKLRIHLKFLTGDYLTKAQQIKSSNPECSFCKKGIETTEHIVASCAEYKDIRDRILSEMIEVCRESKYLEYDSSWLQNDETVAQFILDPTSLNLNKRVNINDHIVAKLFTLTRDMCYAIHNERMRKMRILNQ